MWNASTTPIRGSASKSGSRKTFVGSSNASPTVLMVVSRPISGRGTFRVSAGVRCGFGCERTLFRMRCQAAHMSMTQASSKNGLLSAADLPAVRSLSARVCGHAQQGCSSGYAPWTVNAPQSIFGKSFAPFALKEGTNFMEYGLVYLRAALHRTANPIDRLFGIGKLVQIAA
jgi:hypothetical protein